MELSCAFPCLGKVKICYNNPSSNQCGSLFYAPFIIFSKPEFLVSCQIGVLAPTWVAAVHPPGSWYLVIEPSHQQAQFWHFVWLVKVAFTSLCQSILHFADDLSLLCSKLTIFNFSWTGEQMTKRVLQLNKPCIPALVSSSNLVHPQPPQNLSPWIFQASYDTLQVFLFQWKSFVCITLYQHSQCCFHRKECHWICHMEQEQISWVLSFVWNQDALRQATNNRISYAIFNNGSSSKGRLLVQHKCVLRSKKGVLVFNAFRSRFRYQNKCTDKLI